MTEAKSSLIRIVGNIVFDMGPDQIISNAW